MWKPLTQATLPGTDHACFQTAETDKTPTTCANGHVPLWEYVCRSLPIEAKSSSVRGHDTVTGKDAKESTTRKVESGKRMITKTRGRRALTEPVNELATRPTTLTGNLLRTDGLRVVCEESFSFGESVKDERVGEGAIVGRRDPSMEGVGEGCVNRTKSNICRERENNLGSAMTCLFLNGGIPLVGVTGEGESTASENEEPRFLGEQVSRVSAGLRDVEDARAR